MPKLKKKERKVLLSFASRVDRHDPGALNNLGVLYFRKGMYQEAIEQFKEALKLDPRFDLARENLLYLFAETKMEDPDVKHWKKEVQNDPDNTDALLRLGVSYRNMGRYDEAVETLGRVVEKNPDHFLARMHLGSVLKAQGLYQQSLEHFLCVSGDVGKSAVFHTDLGEIYYNLGRTEEAVSELRTAIKLDADYWRSHFLLSFAYGDNGNLQDALEESRIASRLNPSFSNTEANLALSDFDREGGGESVGGISKDIPSLESTSYTLGVAYRERGYRDEALKEFSKALQEMPDRDRVHIEIGKIHLADGQYRQALESFLKALECNSENSTAYRNLGVVFHLNGHHYQAAVCYLQAYRLNSVDVSAMNNLGVILYQVGLVEEAERMFKKGLNLKLYHLELNYNFLNCTMIKEELLMAENLIQRLEAFMGKSPSLYEKRALLNFKLNRLTLALFDVESALSLDRQRSDAHFLKGLVFLREEDFQNAVEAIAAGALIDPKFKLFHFYLALDDPASTKPAMVDNKLTADPEDDLIELLQSGIKNEIGNLHDVLKKIMARGHEVLSAEKPLEGGKGGGGNASGMDGGGDPSGYSEEDEARAGGGDQPGSADDAADEPEDEEPVDPFEDLRMELEM